MTRDDRHVRQSTPTITPTTRTTSSPKCGAHRVLHGERRRRPSRAVATKHAAERRELAADTPMPVKRSRNTKLNGVTSQPVTVNATATHDDAVVRGDDRCRRADGHLRTDDDQPGTGMTAGLARVGVEADQGQPEAVQRQDLQTGTAGSQSAPKTTSTKSWATQATPMRQRDVERADVALDAQQRVLEAGQVVLQRGQHRLEHAADGVEQPVERQEEEPVPEAVLAQGLGAELASRRRRCRCCVWAPTSKPRAAGGRR